MKMKLIIFHPETNELIDVQTISNTFIADYLYLHGYPDKCYFYVKYSRTTHASKWGRFIEPTFSWKPPDWSSIKPEQIPESARATALLLL